MVETAQKTIEQHWPEHANHKSGTRHARWSTAEGVACACGDVLGWPNPEHHETLSQYTKRIAAERVDAASAPGRIKGAFGEYAGQPASEPSTEVAPDGDLQPSTSDSGHWPVNTTDNTTDVREPGDYPEPEQEPPTDLWDDTPEVEPEPEQLVVEPEPETADEAQAGPPYAVGDVVTVGGIEFVKHSESPFPEHNADLPPWEMPDTAPDEADAEKTADGWLAEGKELTEIPREEIGRDVVPYAGTPIVPGPDAVGDPLNGRLAPLDPTMPYTPQDVELKIVEIMGQLEKSEVMLRQQVAREHQATHNYTMRYNLAIATSDGRAQDQRTAEAVLATERELFEMTQAKMLAKCLRDSQHNLRSQLSGMQSVARSLSVSLVNALDGRVKPSDLPPEPPVPPWERR